MTVTRWWRTFCGNAKKIKGFYVGGLEYNLESLERYLSNQTSSSMKTYLAAHGGDVTELVKMADSATYNKKQEFLLKTQSLINQLHDDYDVAEENALSPTESAALKKAHACKLLILIGREQLSVLVQLFQLFIGFTDSLSIVLSI